MMSMPRHRVGHNKGRVKFEFINKLLKNDFEQIIKMT